MRGIVHTCNGCGSPLHLVEGKTIATCDSCGIDNVISRMLTTDREADYHRASEYLQKSEFERAENLFARLVDDFPQDAELHWKLLISRYGILMQKDPLSGIWKPTIGLMQNTAIMEDPEYQKALQFASAEERQVYEEMAEKIAVIQREYNEIINSEDPFDIFICYKETEIGGKNRTNDSLLAEGIYNSLKEEGYKVFFSRVTLENVMGVRYEPYIYAALSTAKVMIHVTTSKENSESPWVRNEWSRYIKIQARDNSKRLILAYKDVAIDELPAELQSFQGKDMGEPRADRYLLENLERIFGKRDRIGNNSAMDYTKQLAKNSLEQAKLALENNQTKEAAAYLDESLKHDPKNADVYYNKLLIRGNAAKIEDIKDDYAEWPEYKNFCRFGQDHPKYVQTRDHLQLRIACGFVDRGQYDQAQEAINHMQNRQKADEAQGYLHQTRETRERQAQLDEEMRQENIRRQNEARFAKEQQKLAEQRAEELRIKKEKKARRIKTIIKIVILVCVFVILSVVFGIFQMTSRISGIQDVLDNRLSGKEIEFGDVAATLYICFISEMLFAIPGFVVGVLYKVKSGSGGILAKLFVGLLAAVLLFLPAQFIGDYAENVNYNADTHKNYTVTQYKKATDKLLDDFWNKDDWKRFEIEFHDYSGK